MGKDLDYNAKLVGRDDITPKLALFHVHLDEALTRQVVPGQYVAIGLNNTKEPDKGSVTRSMSIASASGQLNSLSFYIRFVGEPASDNPLTHLLWDTKVGDRLYVTRKPVGKFTIKDTMGDDTTKMKVLVAAGTGLAPFVSMATTQVRKDPKVDLSSWVILHGASYASDLGYRETLNALAKSNGLRYLPTISRPGGSDEWTGATGRVEDFFREERLASLEESIGLSQGEFTPAKVGVLICGLQGTIAQSVVRLIPRGFVPFERKVRKALELDKTTESSIWWEQYDSEPVLDLDDHEQLKMLKNQIHSAIGLSAM